MRILIEEKELDDEIFMVKYRGVIDITENVSEHWRILESKQCGIDV